MSDAMDPASAVRVLEALAPGEGQTRTGEGRRVVLRPADSITPSAPKWLWEGRVPIGLVTLFAGREGLGKSSLLVELAARASVGELAGDLHGQPITAVYGSAEDSAATTLVPRFMASGADLSRIHVLEVVDHIEGHEQPGVLSLPDDLDLLVQAGVEVEARMLVLDPVVSYLSRDVNAHRDQDVRRVLAPLASAAAEHQIAVVGVIHLNKGDTTDVLARVSGSVGFTAAARSVLAFARDPMDPEGEVGADRVIAHAKCNVGPLAPSLRARIEARTVADTAGGELATSRVVLLGETDQTARDLLEQPSSSEERSALDEAADFVREELAAGPVFTTSLRRAAEAAGLSWRTVERAKSKKAVSAKSTKSSSGEWQWELISARPTPSSPSGGVGHLPSLEPSKAAKSIGEGRKAATANGIEKGGGLDADALGNPPRTDFGATEEAA